MRSLREASEACAAESMGGPSSTAGHGFRLQIPAKDPALSSWLPFPANAASCHHIRTMADKLYFKMCWPDLVTTFQERPLNFGYQGLRKQQLALLQKCPKATWHTLLG